MLQKFGLIKYNKKFLLENNLNINPIYSPRTIIILKKNSIQKI